MEFLTPILAHDIYTPLLVVKSLIAAGFVSFLSDDD